MKRTDNPDLLTVAEAAEYLRISRNLCYELIRRGRLPHISLTERVIRIPRLSLQQWIERESQDLLRDDDVVM